MTWPCYDHLERAASAARSDIAFSPSLLMLGQRGRRDLYVGANTDAAESYVARSYPRPDKRFQPSHQ